MPTVISEDGTPIAFERGGAGPALIFVDGATAHRAVNPAGRRAQGSCSAAI